MLIKARVTARYDFATLIDKKARSTFYRSLIIKHCVSYSLFLYAILAISLRRFSN